ncbi:hypothetical protein JQ633_00225 [Bradyrhizobium tropiciagri]|uniref:hypothetical protein n=1 Tax=Bradyrhizobium tropiciagri TaxID=312253 RepID=UPI001BABE928|nr:hypothetical protein [Bradyrhizobium tropiciagri]MBR0868764.1 hypothetical protein [Bradyrhizobium tropiciagri]
MSVLAASPSHAQCVDFSDRAKKIDIDTFSKSPIILLESMHNDKDKLKSQLAAYLVTNPDLLAPVRTLITEATAEERSAIGAALRVAEMRCTIRKPIAAQKIASFAQRIEDAAVAKGYYTAGEDQSSVAKLPDGNKKGPAGDGLLSGQWKTEIADPFKPIAIPQ